MNPYTIGEMTFVKFSNFIGVKRPAITAQFQSGKIPKDCVRFGSGQRKYIKDPMHVLHLLTTSKFSQIKIPAALQAKLNAWVAIENEIKENPPKITTPVIGDDGLPKPDALSPVEKKLYFEAEIAEQQARIKKMDADIKASLLLDKADTEFQIRNALTVMVSALQIQLPSAISAAVVGINDPKKVEVIVYDLIVDILKQAEKSLAVS